MENEHGLYVMAQIGKYTVLDKRCFEPTKISFDRNFFFTDYYTPVSYYEHFC